MHTHVRLCVCVLGLRFHSWKSGETKTNNRNVEKEKKERLYSSSSSREREKDEKLREVSCCIHNSGRSIVGSVLYLFPPTRWIDGWLVYCLYIHTQKKKKNESTTKKTKKKTTISPLLYKSAKGKKEITHFESKLIAKRTQDLLLHHYVKPPHPGAQSREKQIFFFLSLGPRVSSVSLIRSRWRRLSWLPSVCPLLLCTNVDIVTCA